MASWAQASQYPWRSRITRSAASMQARVRSSSDGRSSER
jgi:hypothetical protein